MTGVSLIKHFNNTELLLNQKSGTGKMIFYTIFPGLDIAFIYVDSPNWPESEANNCLTPLLINYCITGRSELLLNDNSYIYLKENDICISKQTAQTEYIFPTGHYQGIKFYFNQALLSEFMQNTFSLFDIEFNQLEHLYCLNGKTYVSETEHDLKIIFNNIWKLAQNPSSFYLKIYVFELLHDLLSYKIQTPKTSRFFTETQVEIAKKTEEILSSNLHKHIPIRLLAKHFSISETSLKNYFRGIYGQNISSYMCNLRMHTAAELLATTHLPIAEISIRVGYSNQGKFAANFKKIFQVSPSEYRRAKNLELL